MNQQRCPCVATGGKNSISRPIDLFNLNDHLIFLRNPPSTIEYYSSNPEHVFLSYPQLRGTIMLILCDNIYTFSIKYGQI